MQVKACLLDSISKTLLAPCDRASKPTAPDPANKSQKQQSTIWFLVESKRAFLTRELVGLVPDFGTANDWPLNLPDRMATKRSSV